MNRQTLGLAAMVLGAGVLLAGCQANTPGGMPDTVQVEDSYFYGKWVGQEGRKLTISPDSGKSFKLQIDDKFGRREYMGYLVRVDQIPFAELSVYQPGSSDSTSVPVYLYAQVKIEPTQFTFRPLRAEWLRQAVSQQSGSKYIETPGSPRTEGGVVVRDAAAMQALLRKALSEPGSFETGEEYHKEGSK